MGNKVRDMIPKDVWEAWGLNPENEARKLIGGGNRSIRIGMVVLKPVDDMDEALWSQDAMSLMIPEYFRIADPVRAPSGRFIEAGWMASQWVDGMAGPVGHWKEILHVSEHFHRALERIEKPTFLMERTHRWAVADRVAWGEASLAWLPAVLQRFQDLEQLRSPVNLVSQVIHGDLSGNVLFSDTMAPAVIDFSPYWRPAAFADAVVLMDGLLWHEWDAVMQHMPPTPIFYQLLVRAAIFRLGALNERVRASDLECLTELPLFDRVVGWLKEVRP